MIDATFAQEQSISRSAAQPRPLVILPETVLYAALIALAVILRIAELGSVPLSDVEASRALAAYRSIQLGGVVEIIPDSPILFTLQSLIFGTFGASEGSARIATALAGVLLCVTPLLFRNLLGQWRTLIVTLILTFSPTVLLASRTSSPALWALLFSILGLWAVYRYWLRWQPLQMQLNAEAITVESYNAELSKARYYTLLAAGFFAAAVFLSDSAGYVLALILAGALGVTVWYAAATRSEFDDETSAEVENSTADAQLGVMAFLRVWSWQAVLIAALVTVVLVSTRFLLYQPGLASVSALLDAGLRGASIPQDGAPILYPLFTAFFYETPLWIFSIVSVIVLLRRGSLLFYERFSLVWLALAIFASFLYMGGRTDHALWLIVPLALLTAHLFVDLFLREEPAIWTPSFNTEDRLAPFVWQTPPWWIRWMLALIVLALLLLLAIHVQIIGRGFLIIESSTPGEAISSFFERLQSPQFRVESGSLVWVLMIPLFMIVGFFLTASLWGVVHSLQGLVLGALCFTLVTGLGTGWQAAVVRADDPTELWHIRPNARELFLLSDQLFELTQRETGGWPTLPIVVVVDEINITSDGVLPWLLRDYENARFVTTYNEASGAEVIIAPALTDDLSLGAPYVGDEFVASRGWNLSSMQSMDFIAWWTQRRVRVGALPAQRIVLWLRQDIYDGAPFIGESAQE